ncbi:MAG: hypothetical protein JWM07_24 [Candidatus Saccharibacteria bacterium]|nr:hypothetical protein [Candidatus Saccharibacteria bacterium]
MGTAEDALRARIETNRQQYEEARQRLIGEVKQELATAHTWLEANNWPGGSLMPYSHEDGDLGAMWYVGKADNFIRGAILYCDSTGNLVRRGAERIEVLDEAGYAAINPTVLAQYVIPGIKRIVTRLQAELDSKTDTTDLQSTK